MTNVYSVYIRRTVLQEQKNCWKALKNATVFSDRWVKF